MGELRRPQTTKRLPLPRDSASHSHLTGAHAIDETPGLNRFTPHSVRLPFWVSPLAASVWREAGRCSLDVRGGEESPGRRRTGKAAACLGECVFEGQEGARTRTPGGSEN